MCSPEFLLRSLNGLITRKDNPRQAVDHKKRTQKNRTRRSAVTSIKPRARNISIERLAAIDRFTALPHAGIIQIGCKGLTGLS